MLTVPVMANEIHLWNPFPYPMFPDERLFSVAVDPKMVQGPVFEVSDHCIETVHVPEPVTTKPKYVALAVIDLLSIICLELVMP